MAEKVKKMEKDSSKIKKLEIITDTYTTFRMPITQDEHGAIGEKYKVSEGFQYKRNFIVQWYVDNLKICADVMYNMTHIRRPIEHYVKFSDMRFTEKLNFLFSKGHPRPITVDAPEYTMVVEVTVKNITDIENARLSSYTDVTVVDTSDTLKNF